VRRCAGRKIGTLRKRVMSIDWSWDDPASEYIKIYRDISN